MSDHESEWKSVNFTPKVLIKKKEFTWPPMVRNRCEWKACQ